MGTACIRITAGASFRRKAWIDPGMDARVPRSCAALYQEHPPAAPEHFNLFQAEARVRFPYGVPFSNSRSPLRSGVFLLP